MAATRSPRLRLLHIRDEIDGLSATLEDVTLEAYRGSYPLRRVTERAVQIISEAARALSSDLTDRYPDAPWSAIIGIGNILRHDYQYIDDRRLWEIARVHLPALRAIVVQMLAELGDS
jgi:uncharacterized protein with HEPN domain